MDRLKQIPRTGETELHRMGNLLDRHAEAAFCATEKMDGFSMSLGNVGGCFVISTRDRMVAFNESSVFAEAFRAGVVRPFAENVLVQGELCGPGIRGNPHGLVDLAFFAFDLIVDGCPAGWNALVGFCRRNGFQTVPVLRDAFLPTAPECLLIAEGTNGEGAVFRPIEERRDDFQGRVSFKVFNPGYAHHH